MSRRCLLLALVLVMMAALLPACGGDPDISPEEAARVKKLQEISEQSDMSRVSGFPVTYKGTGTVTKYWHYLRGDVECSREAEVTLTARDDHTCELSLVSPMIVLNPEGEEKPVCGTNGEREAWSMQGTFDPAIQYCVFTTCNRTTNLTAQGRLGFGAKGTKDAQDLACVLAKDGKTSARLVVYTMSVVK